MSRRQMGLARQHQIPVRWAEDEVEELRTKAALRGMSVSEYLRYRMKSDRGAEQREFGQLVPA